MAKSFKLVGLKSYIAAFTGAIVIQKNETIRVSDEIAEKLEDSFRVNAENEEVNNFTAIADDATVDYDFTSTEPAKAKKPVRVKAAPAKVEEEEPATGRRTRAARQRG